MLTVTSVKAPPSEYGMALKRTKNELPMLVVNSRGTVAMLVNHDSQCMCDWEADAILLLNGDSFTGFKNGDFIKKLNLEYFKPYTGKLTIENYK